MTAYINCPHCEEKLKVVVNNNLPYSNLGFWISTLDGDAVPYIVKFKKEKKK